MAMNEHKNPQNLCILHFFVVQNPQNSFHLHNWPKNTKIGANIQNYNGTPSTITFSHTLYLFLDNKIPRIFEKYYNFFGNFYRRNWIVEIEI
jgi:hypothetical protein